MIIKSILFKFNCSKFIFKKKWIYPWAFQLRNRLCLVLYLFSIDILHVYSLEHCCMAHFLMIFRNVKMTSCKSFAMLTNTNIHVLIVGVIYNSVDAVFFDRTTRTLWQPDCNMFPVCLFLFSHTFSISRVSSHSVYSFIHMIGIKIMEYNMNICIDAHMR